MLSVCAPVHAHLIGLFVLTSATTFSLVIDLQNFSYKWNVWNVLVIYDDIKMTPRCNGLNQWYPTFLATRDWLCGRQIFHGPVVWGDGLGMIQAHLLLCSPVSLNHPNRPPSVLVCSPELGTPGLNQQAFMIL